MEDDAKEGSHLSLYLRNYREKLRTMWSAVGQFLEEEFLFIFTCLDFIPRPVYHLPYYACTSNDNVCTHTISAFKVLHHWGGPKKYSTSVVVQWMHKYYLAQKMHNQSHNIL